jgi:hypothetical protein
VKTDADAKKLDEVALDKYLTELLDYIMTKSGLERTQLMSIYNRQSDIGFLDADCLEEPTDEDYTDIRENTKVCRQCSDKDSCDTFMLQNCSKLRR